MKLELTHPQLTKEAKQVLNSVSKLYGAEIERLYHPECVVLFGSFATGAQDEWSDIDLMFVSSRFAHIKRLQRRSTFLIDTGTVNCAHPVLDPHCKTVEEFERGAHLATVTQEVVRTGIALLDRNQLFTTARESLLVAA